MILLTQKLKLKSIDVTPNYLYKLDIKEYKGKIRLAKLNNEDLEKIKYFTSKFFEAEIEEEVEAITNTEKIMTKIKAGVYILEYKNNAIGMARFIGKTDNYAEITSVYIDKAYRNKGFGKELISYMIEIAIQEEKTPVLITSVSNVAAMKHMNPWDLKDKENIHMSSWIKATAYKNIFV